MPDFSLLDSQLEGKIVELSQEQLNGGFRQVKSEELIERSPNGTDLEVHVYNSPLGQGYIVRAKTKIGKKEYLKQVDFGAEGRTLEWIDISPEQ